jgi:serine/threonine protein kinase
VIDRDDPSMIFMIDFGLSKYYRSTDGKHIDFVSKRGMIGTARYSSINALQGME